MFYDSEKFQTASSAARELGLTRERVRQLIAMNRIPGIIVTEAGRKMLPKPCVPVFRENLGRPRIVRISTN